MAKSKLMSQSEDRQVTDVIPSLEEENLVKLLVGQSVSTTEKLSAVASTSILGMAQTIVATITSGGKVLIFGNGGSAAEAEHLAAELVGRFKQGGRRPLSAVALSANSSILTAIGNDFGFEEIYSRQVRALASGGDVVIGISTSGRSRDVLRGVEEARRCGAKTIGLTGSNGGELAEICDHVVRAPSNDVQRIQECHLLIIHIVCELIERTIIGQH
jgi:D-sedoheptulose 7-phosphate isomerase